ncbi:hypothetical protein HOY82DRAFT_510439 [Tuber indicum]|nr:hypothetical protein HOY82DRAFT_510439 [Tuber indicum]
MKGCEPTIVSIPLVRHPTLTTNPPLYTATAVPATKLPCDSDKHPCNLYANEVDCSPEYVRLLQLCVDSGCIQWIMDPLQHCRGDTY